MRSTITRGLIGAMIAVSAIPSLYAAPLAAGDKIGIDFGPTTTANWNNIIANNASVAAGSVINLSGGVIDGVGITTSNAQFTNNDGSNNWVGLAVNGGSAPPEFVDSVTTDISGNFNLGDGSPYTVVVSGLDDTLAYKIDAVSTANFSPIDTVSVNGGPPSAISRPQAQASGLFHSFDKILTDGSGNITITVTDTSAGTNPILNGVLIEAFIDDTPPAITALDPDDVSGVYPEITLLATFDESIVLTGNGSITLTDTGDGSGTVTLNLADSSQVAVSGRDLILTPPAKLAFGTPFEVVIGADTIEDTWFTPNVFPGTTATQWTFTTAAQEFTAPVITTTSPDDGQTGVSPGTSLVATFDQNLLLASGAETVILEEDFESGDGGFTLSGSPNEWAWGTPDSDNVFNLTVTSGNGGSANAWGTNLGPAGSPKGAITAGANSILIGPDATSNGIDLTGVASAQLSFAGAIDAAEGDIVELRIREIGTGDLLTTLLPFGPSPLGTVQTSDWATYGPFDLSAAAGHKVYLEFRYQGTDGSYLGLYIDDVRVTGTDPSSVITLRNLTDGTDTVIPIDDASQVAVSGNTLTINAALALGVDYAVRIGAGVLKNFSDLAFAGINDDTTWNFRTVSSGVLFAEDFENSGLDPETFDGGFGAFTFVTPGANQLNPGVGNAWLNPMPAELGTTFAVLHGSGIVDADLPSTYSANTTYTLTFTHFRRDDVAGDGIGAQLLTPTLDVAAQEGFAAVTEFSSFVTRTVSVTIPADSPLIGQEIKLRLFSDQTTPTNPPQGGIDNIVLSAQRVGEGDTFANWIAGFNLGGQTGFTDDPDGDGIPNGVEAWFGTNPTAGSGGLSQLSQTGSVFSLQHPVADPMLSDVSGSYEWSLDLATWHPDTTTTVGDTTVTINSTSNAGTTTVTADIAGSVNPPDKLFLRAVATQN